MLPGGFDYVQNQPRSGPHRQVSQAGQAVRFTLQGETSFTYTVTASDTQVAMSSRGC